MSDGDGLARERRYALLNAAATIYAQEWTGDHQAAVAHAEALLAEIETHERQQAGHEAWLERSELKEGTNHE